MARVRNWVYTLNNYTDDEVVHLKALNCRYHILGMERGENDTPHVQGYIEFAKPIRFNAVKLLLPRAHIEPRRGSRGEAREYSKKDGDFFEVGIWVEDGERSDLLEVKRMIDAHSSMLSIADVHFGCWVRNHRALAKYQAMRMNREFRDQEVRVYWGVSRSGKTYRACTESNSYHILSSGNGGNVWFDGYDDQKRLIIDDFSSWIPYRLLLRILDKYPLIVETKGGSVVAQWTSVVITSNLSKDEWYPNIHGHLREALDRRIHTIEHFPNIYSE